MSYDHEQALKRHEIVQRMKAGEAFTLDDVRCMAGGWGDLESWIVSVESRLRFIGAQGSGEPVQTPEARIAKAVSALRGLTVMKSQDAGNVVDAQSVHDIADDLENP